MRYTLILYIAICGECCMVLYGLCGMRHYYISCGSGFKFDLTVLLSVSVQVLRAQQRSIALYRPKGWYVILFKLKTFLVGALSTSCVFLSH